ncbi:hypothetical protein [Sporosarcina sp. FA9]|uniref:hypothetical protein n=1 Tax=Sporosarcina sp. FA9 TaxID=3413030 RepID=UPI003F656863
MAEEFFMFDSVDADREVTADDFAKYYHELLTNGVFYRNNLPSLQVVKGTGLVSAVEIGAAFVEGYLYRNTAQINLTHATGNPSFPRIDRVVVRLNRNIANRDIRVVIKQGTPATNPLPPSVERNDLIYELSLSQVRVNAGTNVIATVIDERLDQSLCGIVSSLVQPPTDVYQAEWDDFISSIQLEAPALGGMTISVQSTAPTSPKNKDIWIDTN